MCIYNHRTCSRIDKEKKYPITGANCIILNKYNKRNNGKIISTVAVAYFIKERFGIYSGKYSIIGGRLNKNEDCYIKCMLRELREEAKIKLSFTDFDKYFKDKNGKVKYILHVGKRGNKFLCTPIFIGFIPGISRTIIRKKMKEDNNNFKLNISNKETSDIDCIRLDNMKTLDGKYLDLSSYAESVLRRNDLNKFIE